MSIEEIADVLDMDVSEVKHIIEENNRKTGETI